MIMKRKLWEMYGDLIFNKFSYGGYIKKKERSKTETQLAYNRVYCDTEVHYYIQVVEFPQQLLKNLIDTLRQNLDSDYKGKINVDFLMYTNPYHINWNNSEIRSNRDIWNIYKRSSDNIKSSDEGFKSIMAEHTVKASEYRENSWDYLQKSETENSLALISFVIRVRIPIEDEIYARLLDDILKNAFNKCKICGYQVKNYLFDVMRKMSPFYSGSTDFGDLLINKKTVDSYIISNLMSVYQGSLNDGNLILGNDIFNMQEVKLNTKLKIGGNTNLMILAQAGSGKSMLTKLLDEQIIASNDFLYIIDYKGFEYEEFGRYYGATFLDLGSEEGKYYEPLILSEDTNNSLASLISAVVSISTVLMGHKLSSSQIKILTDAISDIFKLNNIDINDTSTYYRSKNLRLSNILTRLRNYSTSGDKLKQYNNELIDLLNTFEVYFDGIYSYLFKEPVSLSELKVSKIIITKMRNTSTDGVTGDKDVDIKIKQLSSVLIINELARYRRKQDEFFYVQIEELQSFVDIIGVDTWINAMWSEYRQYNGTCIGISNNAEKLKHNVESIINNTEYFIIGKTPDIEGLSKILKNIKLQGLENLMRELFSTPYSFLFRDETTTSVFKALIPTYYAKEQRFVTRTETER